MINLTGAALPLTQAGLANACQQLGVSAPEIWAIIFTETDPPYGGFWADRRPQILFERHVFHKLTNGKFDASHPEISAPRPGNYGRSGAHQYDRLIAAAALDENAALQSASWGIGQTLGENFRILGFTSPQEFVQQMTYSEDQQLLASVREILAAHNASALSAHDWRNFARVYNGPGYAQNNYDSHLSSWYAKFAGGALPDIRIRTVQLYLMFIGYEPSTIDGIWGSRTRSAMNEYQLAIGLSQTHELDDVTFERLVKDGQALSATAVATKNSV